MEYQTLLVKISDEYDGFSPVLKRIADFILTHTEDIVIMTIQDIADRADVNPSALIRFSKELGFKGFKSMQQVFVKHYRQKRSVYAERVSILKQNMASGDMGTLQDTVVRAINQIDTILDEIRQPQIDTMADTIIHAKTVYLYARGRSEPAIISLRYALLGLGFNAIILPSEDNLAMAYLHNADSTDCLVAVSFKNYWGAVKKVLHIAKQKNMIALGITDVITSPVYLGGTHCVCIKDDASEFPRTLSGTMVVVEAIIKTIAIKQK